jgi:hypothetical protein
MDDKKDSSAVSNDKEFVINVGEFGPEFWKLSKPHRFFLEQESGVIRQVTTFT